MLRSRLLFTSTLAFVLAVLTPVHSRAQRVTTSATAGQLEYSTSDTQYRISNVLLHTTLDNVGAIASPVVGVGGTSTLLPSDFVAGHDGSGAHFVGSGKVVTFPAVHSGVQNVELDRGEVEFWYRPNYDADADDIGHALVVIGNVYNAPRLSLMESDRLSISLVDANWQDHTAWTEWRAPLWAAGQWVHIRATWDTFLPTDALKIYVDGVRVDLGAAAGGWNLGSETDIGDVFLGSGNTAGDFIADGVIDELIIRDAAQPPATATPTSTPTPTGTASAGPRTTTPTATADGAPPSPGAIGITDPDLVVTPAALPLQPVGVPFVDPVFGTILRRVSNASENSSFGTHIYSQLQAFSTDNVYLLLIENGEYVVRRVDNLSLVTGLDSSEWNIPRWHPTQPHTVIHFDTNADTVVRLQFTDVDTLTTTTVFTFPAQYERVRVNQSFDEISEDGRWLAGMVSRSDGAQVIFALDLQNLTLGTQLPIPDLYAGPCESDPQWPEAEPDWIGVSPLGNYLVVQWARDGTTRCSGLETFDLQSGAFVGRVYDGHQHGDLGVDADGVTEFFMTFEMAAPPPDNDRPAIGVRVLPGTSTVSPPAYVQVLDWGNGEHISCRGSRGVCLVTAGTWDINGWTPFEGELFLQYTDGAVRRLVHHRSSSCGYWVQPRASISRDGRYVVFASDWGQGTGTSSCSGGNDLGRGDPYIIDLMAGTPSTPTPTPTPTGSATTTPTAPPTATHTPTIASTTPCLVDFNGNGVVDVVDVQTVTAWWHRAGFPPEADVNDDGVVDIVDITAVATQWGQRCS